MNTYKKLLPQIRGIVNSVKNFNNAYEEEDYFQEAYLACLEASAKYRKATDAGRTKMQDTVHAVFFIKKHLYSMADTGEIMYRVYSPTGEYVKTIHNSEYRKNKKKLADAGYTFESISIVESIYKEDADGNETEMQIEGGIGIDGDVDDDYGG